MKLSPRWIAQIFLTLSVGIAFLLATGCDNPQLADKNEKVPDRSNFNQYPEDKKEIAKSTAPTPVEEPAPAPKKVAPSGPPPEPIQPTLQAAIHGSEIHLRARIKSYFNEQRISDTMTNAFPDFKVVLDIKSSPDYQPVGWTSRVAPEFLVPFFRVVPDGFVDFQDGKLTLKGTVQGGSVRTISETATAVFSGPGTKEIDNQLRAENEKPKESKLRIGQ